jgi:hypothetical protein
MLAAAIVLLAAPASAEVYTWTYRGFVLDGLDETGVFGAPGADLSGQRWTARVTTDTDAPDAVLVDLGYASAIAAAPGIVRMDFTMAGQTFTFGAGNPDPTGNYTGEQVQVDGPFHDLGVDFDHFEYFRHVASNDTNFVGEGFSRFRKDQLILGGYGVDADGQPSPDTDFLPGGDFRTLPSLVSGPGLFMGGSLAFFSTRDYLTTGQRRYYNNANANLLVTSLTAGAAPEPRAWALMIVGFGLTGAGLRRRYRLGRYATSTLPAVWPKLA